MPSSENFAPSPQPFILGSWLQASTVQSWRFSDIDLWLVTHLLPGAVSLYFQEICPVCLGALWADVEESLPTLCFHAVPRLGEEREEAKE